MTDQENKVRWEQNFRDIFHRLNQLLPVKTFTISIVVLIGMWTSLFGFMYVDQQSYKEVANKQYIEVVKELGNIKTLIAEKNK